MGVTVELWKYTISCPPMGVGSLQSAEHPTLGLLVDEADKTQ